jgi:ketosteroid isomerase-like protein
MSRRHVELLSDMYGQRTMEEFATSLHPAAELRQARAIPDTDDYYGRDEFVRGVGRWLEEWDRFRFIPEEIIDLGEQVFMRLRLSGRAKASGVKLDQPAFHLWTFREGMPWRCEVFFEEQQARDAAGMAS